MRYGGNTSCVEVRSASGALLVIDCGTGAHSLGQALLGDGSQPLRGQMLISHTHWDHIQGFPFFAPLFVPGNEWDIYAPRGFGESLRDSLSGQMQYTYFPIDLDHLGASIRYHNLIEGQFSAGEFVVEARYLNHPALTFGYRVTVDGATIVYACDHEPHARRLGTGLGVITGQDRDHVRFLSGADLVIHDAQYTPQEFETKVGWGHSTPEYAIAVCRAAGAKRLALTHHDPMRTDAGLDVVISALRENFEFGTLDVFAAAEGMTVEFAPAGTGMIGQGLAHSLASLPTRIVDREVLLVSASKETRDMFHTIAQLDDIGLTVAENGSDAVRCIQARKPSLVILDQYGLDGSLAETARLLRRSGLASDDPMVAICSDESLESLSPVVTDTLTRPFSAAYARTKVAAWLLRRACRWMRPAIPADESSRIATLNGLAILDTPPEARFDRLTALAASTFDMPIVLVSLVDTDRQWFKSRVGLGATETSREMSFCGHAILNDLTMVVRDTQADPRFADNPLVTGEPRIRFYAGRPLRPGGRGTVGTLCLIDTRPRDLGTEEMRVLESIAELVERELEGGE